MSGWRGPENSTEVGSVYWTTTDINEEVELGYFGVYIGVFRNGTGAASSKAVGLNLEAKEMVTSVWVGSCERLQVPLKKSSTELTLKRLIP